MQILSKRTSIVPAVMNEPFKGSQDFSRLLSSATGGALTKITRVYRSSHETPSGTRRYLPSGNCSVRSLRLLTSTATYEPRTSGFYRAAIEGLSNITFHLPSPIFLPCEDFLFADT